MATIERVVTFTAGLVPAAAVSGLCLLTASGGSKAQGFEGSVFPASNTSSVRVGDLRSIVGSLLDPTGNTTQGFTFTPSIGDQILVTDNVLAANKPRVADVATFITPQLVVTGQTQRIQANISYSPSIQVYAKTSRQDQIVQNFNGQTVVTAVPDTVFLSLRGYGSEQATTANAGQSNSPILNNQNREQTLGFTASPYATHRFGGEGTATVGYVYTYTQSTGSNVYGQSTLPSLTTQSPFITNNQLLANGLAPTFGNSFSRTNEEYATLTTGENFGRFSDSLRLDASQLTGSGVLTNARRSTAIDSVGYGITRTVAVIGSFGYEDISYAGIPPVRIRDAVYTGGVRLTPNQNSTLTVTYGHKDGFNAATLSTSYQVTPRLRVFGNYSEGLSTSQQEIQDNLTNSTVDQYGNSIDNVTGAPVLINDQLLGLQSGLYRLKRASGTAVLTYDVDTISLNVLNENRTILSTSPGQTGFSDKGTIASVTWTHQLNPALTGTASGQFGISTSQTVPTSTVKNASLSLTTGYALSETLSANAQYFVNDLTSNVANQSYVQNVFLIGLRKSF